MKKALCALLVFSLIFSGAVPAFAGGACPCGKTPLVVVSGMGSLPLIKDRGLSSEIQAWPPVVDKNALIAAAVAGTAAAAVSGNPGKLLDFVLPAVKKIVEPAACDADGNSKYDVGFRTFPSSMADYPDFVAEAGSSERGMMRGACDVLGSSHVYFFKYDWRLDPIDNAEDLHALIQTAVWETGHQQVDLGVASSGGNVTLAYFQKYGGASVENCVFASSVFGGSLMAGDLFSKRIAIDKDYLVTYLRSQTDASRESGSFETLALDLADGLGLLNIPVGFANRLIGRLIPRVFDEVLKDTFCAYPGLWALIRDEDYETAKAGLLDRTVNANLIRRIDAFHYNIRENRKPILDAVMEQGVRVAFCSHYNSYTAPFFPSSSQHSDDTVESVCTSAEAYFAPLGSTLPKGYEQKKRLDGKNYLSPDNIVDASASMFPDKVWFFKNVGHVGCAYGSEHNAFVLWLLWYDGQPTVWSDAAHPQFMATDDDGKTLYPLTGFVNSRFSFPKAFYPLFRSLTDGRLWT